MKGVRERERAQAVQSVERERESAWSHLMAASSTSTSSCPLFSTNTLHSAPRSTAPRCVGLPPQPPVPLTRSIDSWKSVGYCRKITRNAIVMAAGDTVASVETTVEETVASVEPAVEETVAPPETVVVETSAPEEPTVTETPPTAEQPVRSTNGSTEIVKSIQEAWDKLEDKYAVSSLAFAGFVGLVGTAGFISAVDRIPLLPGIFELVGIGYSGWFAYKNLIPRSKREALLAKIKSTYEDITGISS